MKRGFTLIELLATVAIIAVLAIVVVLTLNPAEYFRQSRDANRVSDMDTLAHAIFLYESDQGTNSVVGTASVVYVSLPDPTISGAATSTCSYWNLPALPSGDTYQCSSSQDYKNVNGTGWIPIKFSGMTTGSPIGSLPVDPTNTSSTGLYYTYNTDGVSQYETTSIFESSKYKAQYGQNPIDPDYPEVDAKGNSLSLSPLFNPSGLIGWWPLNEGSGTVAFDQSGNGDNAKWGGTKIGSSGYYTAGKVGTYAGDFDGSTDSVTSTATLSDLTTDFTIVAWVYKNADTSQAAFFSNRMGAGYVYFGFYTTNIFLYNNVASPAGISAGNVAFGQWEQVAAVATPSTLTFYLNGSAVYSTSWTNADPGTGNAGLGYDQPTANYWGGLINDIRVYDRALSASEIQALYDAEK